MITLSNFTNYLNANPNPNPNSNRNLNTVCKKYQLQSIIFNTLMKNIDEIYHFGNVILKSINKW